MSRKVNEPMDIKEYIYERLLSNDYERKVSDDETFVTELVYDCLRRAYYSRKIAPTFDLKTVVTFFIGNAIHTYKLAGKNEMSISWNNIRGRVDDYDPETGVLFEKKTTYSGVRSVLPHHLTQVEYYKVLLEKNGYKVSNGYVVYVNVVDRRVMVFPVVFRPSEEIEAEMLKKKETLIKSLKENKPPKRYLGWLCEYCPFAGICFSKGNLKLSEIMGGVVDETGE